MIRLQNNSGDFSGRQQIDINQGREDKKAQFVISLLTGDLPSSFINSPGHLQKVDTAIVDLDENNIQINDDSLMIPLVLTSVASVNDQVRYYYRQKFDGQQSSISTSANIDCFVMRDKGETDNFKNPYLMITFGVMTEDDLRQHTGDSQGRQNYGYDPNDITGQAHFQREHVSENENANGGLLLPVGEQKNDLEMQKREERGTQDA